MKFIHYKDFQPVNLDKVGTIGKENQMVAQDAVVYAIAFYEFERKVGYWVFTSVQERDAIYSKILQNYSNNLEQSKTLNSISC